MPLWHRLLLVGSVVVLAGARRSAGARASLRRVMPNEKLASDTIRNATIVSRETLAEVTAPVPLAGSEVFVSGLDGAATVTIRASVADEPSAEQLERELGVRAHERLPTAGIFA